jgi:hypothetical protein
MPVKPALATAVTTTLTGSVTDLMDRHRHD